MNKEDNEALKYFKKIYVELMQDEKYQKYSSVLKYYHERIIDLKHQLEEKDKIIDEAIEILEEYKKICESKLNFEKSMHSPTANHNATYWKDCIDKLNYILSILYDKEVK